MTPAALAKGKNRPDLAKTIENHMADPAALATKEAARAAETSQATATSAPVYEHREEVD